MRVMDTGFSPSVIACFTAISISLSLWFGRAVVTYNSHVLPQDFHVGLTLGVFTRCYSHHHGYFLFLHLIICLNSVGDRDGEMGNWFSKIDFWVSKWVSRWKCEPSPLFSLSQVTILFLSLFLSFECSSERAWSWTLFSFLFSFSPSLPHTLQAFPFWQTKTQTIRPCIQILQLMSHFNILFIPFHILLRSSS